MLLIGANQVRKGILDSPLLAFLHAIRIDDKGRRAAKLFQADRTVPKMGKPDDAADRILVESVCAN